MKGYTIVISSAEGTGDTNDRTYKFDWSILPKGEYEMSFTFMSEPLKTLVGAAEGTAQAMAVEFVCPLSYDAYRVDTNGFANSSNVVGLLEVQSVEGVWDVATDFSMRHWKSKVDNPKIQLYGVPQGNEFKVRLLKTNGALATITPTKYDMIVNLKHIC